MVRATSDWAGNVGAFLIVITVNVMANALPIGGQTTGEISDKYPSLFTPADYVFSIWGLIYLGLSVFIVWQALPAQRMNRNMAAIRIPFLVNCVSNVGWIFVWHYDLLALSLILMFFILGSLIQIYNALNIGLSNAPATERWIVHLPFSVYTSWITVATIANISAVQIAQDWDDLGIDAVSWTIIKIAIAGTIAVTVLFRRRDFAFVLVVLWATFGIAIKHAATPMVSGASYSIALLGSCLIVSELVSRPRGYPLAN